MEFLTFNLHFQRNSADLEAQLQIPNSCLRQDTRLVSKMPWMRVARERKAPLCESLVTAHVGIGREESGFFKLAVELEISVPGRDRAEVEEMVRIAHEEVCPYSRATRGNIEVNLRVV